MNYRHIGETLGVIIGFIRAATAGMGINATTFQATASKNDAKWRLQANSVETNTRLH
tara:strand:+ start:3238 stop:3408 length:171 start_codon:yes stop_codon:yes gene_type:complete